MSTSIVLVFLRISRSHCGLQKVNEKVDANKAACNGHATLKCLANLQPEDQAEDGDDDREHNICSGTKECLEGSIDAVNDNVH